MVADKYNLFCHPPNQLFFQLQRVEYDTEKKMLKKFNDPFYFDAEIYIDRFLSDNYKVYLQIRSQV